MNRSPGRNPGTNDRKEKAATKLFIPAESPYFQGTSWRSETLSDADRSRPPATPTVWPHGVNGNEQRVYLIDRLDHMDVTAQMQARASSMYIVPSTIARSSHDPRYTIATRSH